MNSNIRAQRKSWERHVPFSVPFALVNASTGKLSQKTPSLKRITAKIQNSHGVLSKVAPMLSEFIEDERSVPAKGEITDITAKDAKRRYVIELRRVLYIKEFVLLVNYTEVVIPVVFCKFPPIFFTIGIPGCADCGTVAQIAGFGASSTSIRTGEAFSSSTEQNDFLGVLQRTKFVAALCMDSLQGHPPNDASLPSSVPHDDTMDPHSDEASDSEYDDSSDSNWSGGIEGSERTQSQAKKTCASKPKKKARKASSA
ncbi:unnamed protein product [Phytophthora fragariaefolia]|uniref:Unnamed protein product n=1 Tax=Phytophthora fragariaefolia TaxID=1490495 RepID=A0A9W7CXA9_9STRA|nr:unnamed protein product [Phytophthora fragariaefolia]